MKNLIAGFLIGLSASGAVYASTLVSKDGFTLKSPDGTCAEMTIDNSDAWVATPVGCP